MSYPFGKVQPELTSVILEDDGLLARALDEILRGDSEYKKLTIKILSAQVRLKKLATKETWLAYLSLEEVTNYRLTFILALVVRWAFNEGRRHQRQLCGER
jgi:hypothetical protein